MKQTILPISTSNKAKSYVNSLQSIRKLLMDNGYYTKKFTPPIFLKLNTDDKTDLSYFYPWKVGEQKGGYNY